MDEQLVALLLVAVGRQTLEVQAVLAQSPRCWALPLRVISTIEPSLPKGQLPKFQQSKVRRVTPLPITGHFLPKESVGVLVRPA